MGFLLDNLGTIIVGGIIVGIIAAVIVKLINDRKKGGCTGCGCGCASSGEKPNCRGKEN